MEFIINQELLSKCGGGSAEYWFSYKDYTVKNISEFSAVEKPEEVGQTVYFVSLGIIPFITVSNEEIMRAFVKKKGSTKLNAVLNRVNNEDFIETFWKYFNAYPELKDGFDEFTSSYMLDKIIDWCKENNIEYSVQLN